MKRCLIWMLVCVLCLGMVDIAGADDNPEYGDYLSFIENHDVAIDQQKKGDVDITIELFYENIRFYETTPTLQQFPNALLYYNYELARVELYKVLNGEEPDYMHVAELLVNCTDEDFFLASFYRGFAIAMEAMKNKEYQKALDHIRPIPINYEFISISLEIAEACERLLNIQPIPVDLIIMNAYPSEDNAVTLNWKGNQERYIVSWTSDLMHGRDIQYVAVEGETYTVVGLLPNTNYRFTVEYQGVSDSIDQVTCKQDEKYAPVEGEKRLWRESVVTYRLTNRAAFLNSGKTIVEFSNDRTSFKEYFQFIENQRVALLNPRIFSSCIVFMFSVTGIPEDISGKEYQLLLHVDGLTTLTESGVFGAADETGVIKVCGYEKTIYVLVYDLLDRLVQDYSGWSGRSFSLELLVDGKFVADVNGQLE